MNTEGSLRRRRLADHARPGEVAHTRSLRMQGSNVNVSLATSDGSPGRQSVFSATQTSASYTQDAGVDFSDGLDHAMPTPLPEPTMSSVEQEYLNAGGELGHEEYRR